MMVPGHPFLQATADEIGVYRESYPYAKNKLDGLAAYIDMMNTSMREQWPNRCYIDLMTGPGKNRIVGTSEVFLGSPLLALTAPHPADRFFFNDRDPEMLNALQKRVQVTSHADRVTWYCDDANKVVDDVSLQLDRIRPYSLNLAFLDPTGLQIHWETVEKLARKRKMDFVILFPTMGIRRNAHSFGAVSRFFGTDEWHSIYWNSMKTQRIQRLIQLYLGRLKRLGYKIAPPDELERAQIVARNSTNAEVYSIIFASKHSLGNRFSLQAAKRAEARRQPQLL